MESVHVYIHTYTHKSEAQQRNNISQARFTPFAPKGLKKRERERHEKARKTRAFTTMRFKQMPPRFNYRITARILKHIPEEQRSGTGVLPPLRKRTDHRQ